MECKESDLRRQKHCVTSNAEVEEGDERPGGAWRRGPEKWGILTCGADVERRKGTCVA